MENRRTLKGGATSDTFLTTKKLLIILGRHTLYIICISLLSGCLFIIYGQYILRLTYVLQKIENRKLIKYYY